jgi:guanosine-3',5'-bis(diphosphate) 3'-pyrophosphohydrolase
MTLSRTAGILAAAAFAAAKHRDQRRKDEFASPYINHPIAVANVLATEAAIDDETLIVAALLHDTVEDTETTFDELERSFGAEVRALVAEVTDDKDLPKEERKRRQVEQAPKASRRAKLLKIADKIANLRDIASTPPSGWPHERKVAYLDWATRVVEGCRGVHPRLEALFDATLAETRETLEA